MIAKVTIDPRLKKRIESILLSPPRVFVCPTHGQRDRHGVNKDGNGGYVCIICKQPVKVYAAEKGR